MNDEPVQTSDIIYTYLWKRGVEKMGFLKYARWKLIIKYKEPSLSDIEIRKVFQKLVKDGHFIQSRHGKRTHFDYIFSQKPLLTNVDKNNYITQMTKPNPLVSFS